MRLISPRTHSLLDLAVVTGFFVLPALLHMGGRPGVVAYSLGFVHLVVTLCTAFPLGVVKVLPYRIHGLFELAAALFMVASPWFLDFADQPVGRAFFVGGGVVMLGAWAASRFVPVPALPRDPRFGWALRAS